MAAQDEPPSLDDQARLEIIMKHGHQDLVQAVAFNAYGDRCATGSVDGKIRVFNRHRDGVWRLCDNWTAHGGEILELQWLPPTIYPNLLASLGIEGRFKLWTEDPGAAPGRRFSQRAKGSSAKAAFETRSPGAAYRSFSLKHNDETRHTLLALLAADGMLSVLENEQPENLADFAPVCASLRVCPRPPRGEEASFRVRFDPNPEPCYTALRAGVRPDALGLVVAAMDTVKIYRSRATTTASYGLQARGRALYLAAEIKGHRGLVRDVAWAPGNFRGYDIIASACQDGYVRVVRLDTPGPAAAAENAARSWSAADIVRAPDSRRKDKPALGGLSAAAAAAAAEAASSTEPAAAPGDAPCAPGGAIAAHYSFHGTPTTGSGALASAVSTPASAASSLSSAAAAAATGSGAIALAAAEEAATLDSAASMASSTATSFSGAPAADSDRLGPGGSGADAGLVRHTVRELSRMENHRTPVWRVAFDDDGQILGSAGDDGKLQYFRQTPDGTWARSAEMTVLRTRLTAPGG